MVQDNLSPIHVNLSYLELKNTYIGRTCDKNYFIFKINSHTNRIQLLENPLYLKKPVRSLKIKYLHYK